MALPDRFISNAPTVALTALRSLGRDPVVFGMQVARRYPQLVRAPLDLLSQRVSGGNADLVHAWVAGDPEALEQLLREAQRSRGGLGLFGAEVATAAGYPEMVADDSRIRQSARARAAWMLGEIDLALELAPPRSAYARTLRAEHRMMTPGMRLRTDKTDTGVRGNAVLHLLTNSRPHTQSGYTLRSHNVLLAQRDAGVAVEALTRPGYPVVVGALAAEKVDHVDGIDYRRALPAALAAAPDARLQQYVQAAVAQATQGGVRAIHTTTNYANGIVAQAVAEALDVPWTYEVRGMQEQTWIASLATEEGRTRALASERYRLMRAREAQIAGAADAVFTLSEGMREDLAARGVAAEGIHVMPNGIDEFKLEVPVRDAADARAELGLPRDGFWVGAVSSLVDYEGHDTLVEAVRLLRSEGTDARLRLVGDGVSRPALQRLAAELGDAAVLPGRVTPSDAQRHLDALDVVVVPRKDRQVTRSVAPLKPIEAMAAGKPLLVSDLPPLVETVGADLAAAGAVVPPEDARALAQVIRGLSEDPELCTELGRLGRQRAAECTWQQLGRRYAEVYAAVAPVVI